MIKFNKYNVIDTETKEKARVHYSAFKMTSTGQDCVTLYAKDYDNDLYEIFGEIYENDTNAMVDHFEKGKVRIIKGHELYADALLRANA